VSPRAWQNRIKDILTCARNIQEFTAGMSPDSFLNDLKTIRAVDYELTTIGEAVRVPTPRNPGTLPGNPMGKNDGDPQCSGA
jgi:uncharacterized protein with HEPN domain